MVSLFDASLEKLCAYATWLSRLLPSCNMPADITITDDMLTLSAFKLQKGEEGSPATPHYECRTGSGQVTTSGGRQANRPALAGRAKSKFLIIRCNVAYSLSPPCGIW